MPFSFSFLFLFVLRRERQELPPVMESVSPPAHVFFWARACSYFARPTRWTTKTTHTNQPGKRKRPRLFPFGFILFRPNFFFALLGRKKKREKGGKNIIREAPEHVHFVGGDHPGAYRRRGGGGESSPRRKKAEAASGRRNPRIPRRRWRRGEGASSRCGRPGFEWGADLRGEGGF